jgi:glycosyltransferase involved in cell wall biosynthesis
MKQQKVLISTITPKCGGVTQMNQFISKCLDERGLIPVLAYYEPYGLAPELSVPSFKLFQRKINIKEGKVFKKYDSYAIGAWLPELEFTHYLPNRFWKQLTASCEYHITISGNCVPATPFLLMDKPYLAWIATPWMEDRKERISLFPWYRKMIDYVIIRKVIRSLEKQILEKGTILALSSYTQQKLEILSNGNEIIDILHMPIDLNRFVPDRNRVIPRRLGFTGRYNDPRKNVELLLRALKICIERGHRVTAELIGERPDIKLRRYAESLGLSNEITYVPYLDHEDLKGRLQTFDVFVIPSRQEGLCIAALEAMACGCPIISTRCGGPEEFVIDNETGFLVDFDPPLMADVIVKITQDRSLRMKLSEGARNLVEERYNSVQARKKFWNAFEKTFPVMEQENL